MRWLLADPQNPADREWQQQVVAATDRWWQAFQANAPAISQSFSQRGKFDVVRFMDENLGPLNAAVCWRADLSWEFGPARRAANQQASGSRLVLTPESYHWLRPVLGYVLGRAPQIPNWEFYAHRLPEDAEHVRAAVQGRQGVSFQQAGIEARVGRNRKIDLLYTFPQEKWDEDKARQVAFVITETLMGEEMLDAWIGGVDVADAREPGHRWLPFERGQATVTALAQSLLEQLPAQPWFRVDKQQANWSNYKLEAERGLQDYPQRSDLVVGSTCCTDVLEAALSGTLFDSRCHSRHNEFFCYLKIDATQVPNSARVEQRANIEDPLDEALQRAGVGGSIGGGSGLLYSYIDLSLTNVNQAVPIIRQVLAQQRAPLRTWLLFLDSQFAHEWAGAYPQTPPPPVDP
ncbi:hypothetical protein ETAA8_60510 [Anatilimnocola aggregata]|uniref:Uncharacterized protein n=1 Tax=Anatilimnocola aggregata TaxID=2528021 RepID=A0A517YL03_9BACT|nr:hypothetical protein [Anatilimnocola aggregata]QDU30902.1 hypothetical protein ETAA8_60510 [Anatilimnocola aggregata]